MKLHQILYISNLLSITRVVLLIPIYFLFKLQTTIGNYLIVVVMFMVVATDYFDGRLARKFEQRSDLGRILDPVADKICVLFAALMLIKFRDLPVWYVILLAARDLSILLIGLMISLKKRIVVESNKIGKVTVAGLALVIISFTLDIGPVQWIFLWISVGLVAISSLSYLREMIKLIKGAKT